MNWLTSNKVVTALAYASGTAARAGAIVDMQGYEGIVALVKVAAIEAAGVNSIKMQQDTDAAGGTMADLEGTSISIADDDDDQIFAIEVFRPKERYVRLYVTKDASHAMAESAEYILYGPKELPVDNNVDDLITSEIHASPAEGTA